MHIRHMCVWGGLCQLRVHVHPLPSADQRQGQGLGAFVCLLPPDPEKAKEGELRFGWAARAADQSTVVRET